ncbi:MAG: DUF1398 family protein [Flavobacteriales bacterium]|nr:DUF1398 family protein [Flavobacteriales bacterium]
MFTIDQIEAAHQKVKSGADFPKYIQEIKQIGVIAFETWVFDSHTDYFGKNGFHSKSLPQYSGLDISKVCEKKKFISYLKSHQNGETDYHTFCKHCAESGIEKWKVNLDVLTCVYFDMNGNEVLVESIPSSL